MSSWMHPPDGQWAYRPRTTPVRGVARPVGGAVTGPDQGQRMMRRVIVPSLAAAMVLSATVLPASGQVSDPVQEVTLLHDTHVHGKYVQNVSGTNVDIARYFRLVENIKAEKDALFLANGDDIGPSVFSGLFEPNGIHMIEALNEAPLDVNTFGNHEFDYGPENLREIIAAADFPYVTANLRQVVRDEGDADEEFLECPPGVGSGFRDVPATSTHADNIRCGNDLDLLKGKRDGRFDPAGSLTRGQAATVIDRIANATDRPIEGERRSFPDVPRGYTHRDAIERLAGASVVNGFRDGTFRPEQPVTRGQLATLLVRYIEFANDEPLPMGRAFDDVPPDTALSTILRKARAAGIFNGVKGNQAQPLRDIRRDQAASLFVRSLDSLPLESSEGPPTGPGEVFGADLGVEEFLTFEVGGVTVGVTGLAPEGMASITTLGPDTVQIRAEEALDIVVPKMRAAGADLIVVSSHLCGTDAKRLANEYTNNQVHVYAGDHCGVYEPELYRGATGAVVSLVADEYQYLGELNVTMAAGEVVNITRTVHTMTNLVGGLEPLPAIQAVRADYEARLDAELNVVIGEREVPWDTRNASIRNQENAAGNFFTDVMRTGFGGSDIAVTNSGGIRGNQIYPAGDITRRHIAEIFPFGNRLVQAEISGATLKDALEHSVRRAPNLDGGFLQVSGMSFTYDSSRQARTYNSESGETAFATVVNPGDRVTSVTIGGQPLDPARTYTMATNDFTLGGGDGFHMFRDSTRTTVDRNSGRVLDSFIIDYIEEMSGPVTTGVEGRIVNTSS
jgi:2',3'-cyclic-nucleotide 2'-phosphodiesterase (5'-nucleotidase family)